MKDIEYFKQKLASEFPQIKKIKYSFIDGENDRVEINDQYDLDYFLEST